jgi:uncharacterized protein
MAVYRSRPLDREAIAEILAAYDGVRAVYLFGSQALGRAQAGSDIDLAVVPRDSAPRPDKLAILGDLAAAGFTNVDLVFLDTDDIVLKFEVVRLNDLIYQAPDFDSGTYFSKIVRMYWDFLPYLRIQREAYKRRILDGTQ